LKLCVNGTLMKPPPPQPTHQPDRLSISTQVATQANHSSTQANVTNYPFLML